MSSNRNSNTASRRSVRRNRHKSPFKPANTGKPRRVRSAGTRDFVKQI